MKIFNQSGTEILDVLVDDSSVRYRSIMNDDSLTLNFSLTESVEIPLYSYVLFEGSRYTLWRPEEFKKNGTRNHEYTLTLHGYREFLKFVKFKDTSSKPYRLKFFLTGKPVDFMIALVNSLNDKDDGWSVGDCIDAPEKTLSFNHEYCLDVLARFATEFNTEYEFEGKKIHLRKVDKFKDDPLPLSYGKGNGFLPGVGRYNDGDKRPIGRLYVQGGERNIDFSTYGSKTLLLPKSATIEYGGKTYRTDADGMYITRDGNNNAAEDSFDAGEIYPSRVGTVTAVEVIDAVKNFYDIIDSTIPETLDYGNCRIAGEKATIVFQTGSLAGREFDIEQTDDAFTGYIHAERRFKIVPAEQDGIVMPGGVFVPTVGDKYAVFNIRMPEAYISDDASETGASWDMFREAVKYFAENEEDKFRFTGELDGIWSKNRWLEIGGKIIPGGYILFSDTQFQPQGVLIRIIAVKDYVNKPHKPEITLSNAPVSGSFSAELGKLEADEVVIEESKKESIRFTKRQWRDARETISMLEQSLLRFSGSISPITVQTMQLLVGDESLQFRFVNSKTNPVPVDHSFIFDQQTGKFTTQAGILQHMTLGITDIKNSHAADEYKYWDIAAYTSPILEADKAYYLYAKCSVSQTTGAFVLSETAIGMEEISGYYHFLVGILNSQYEDDRSFVILYGFTEILPGRITTDKIVSTDGKTYFDLLSGIIGGRIKFISTSETEEDLGQWADGISHTASDALAKANKSKAITDKFGTTVDGGLISTVITEFREADSEQVTGLISGIQGANKDLPFLVAGGTYAEGIAGTAKAIIRHDGSVKFTDAEITGTIHATSGDIGKLTLASGGHIELPPSFSTNIKGRIDSSGLRLVYDGDNSQAINWYTGLGTFAGDIKPDSNGHLNIYSSFGIKLKSDHNIWIGSDGLSGSIYIGNSLKTVDFGGAILNNIQKITSIGFPQFAYSTLEMSTDTNYTVNHDTPLLVITSARSNSGILKINANASGGTPSDGMMKIIVNASTQEIRLKCSTTGSNIKNRAPNEDFLIYGNSLAILVYFGGYWRPQMDR